MGFREVSVVGVKEILRLWLRGNGQRAIARRAQVDRKTVRRYVDAACAAGLHPGDGEEKLTDELLGEIVEAIKPGRPSGVGHTRSWELLSANRSFIDKKLKENLTVTKVHDLLTRRIGETVPYRTLHRFCVIELDHGKAESTVRVADCDPGEELQADFGRMGVMFDADSARRRVLWALILTAVYSRHMFVWLTFRQTLDEVIAGFEAGWQFFGGVFKVVIPDNMKTIVTKADATDPRINDAFYEYAQARGFVIDPARVAHPQDKPRVERAVPYVRNSFFAGEDFIDRTDAQARAQAWCLNAAGMRIHGTTQHRPLEVFRTEELAQLLLAPTDRYDIPVHSDPKVHRDHHIEVARALYSVPGDLIGRRVHVRADSTLVKVFYQGKLVKVHPRMEPGRRSTDAQDYPEDKRAYALRDLGHLVRAAHAHGPHIGAYTERLLDNPLPWTKMRQVYRLLGLVRRYGDVRVDHACAKTLELDVTDVSLVTRMLERALEHTEEPDQIPQRAQVVPLRFARDPSDFKTGDTEGGAL